jgi:hypothetical protein
LQVIRLASICTPFSHYSMAASPCGHFIAVAGDRGLVAIYRVVRGRYDAAAIAQQVAFAAEYRQRRATADKLFTFLDKMMDNEATPEERAAAEIEVRNMQNQAQAEGVAALRMFMTLQMMAAEKWDELDQARKKAAKAAAEAAAAGQASGGGVGQAEGTPPAPLEQASTAPAPAAAAAITAGSQQGSKPSWQQAQHEQRELSAADGQGPWEEEEEEEEAARQAVDAGWRLEHVATLALAATHTQTMVNCVRWGRFGGKMRLMAACQVGGWVG